MKLTTFGAVTFGDTGIINSVATAQGFSTGLPVNGYAGSFAFVIGGTGAGQKPGTVASNGNHTYTLTQPLDIPLDATSIVIILAPGWKYNVPTPQVTFDGRINFFGPPLVAELPVKNYLFRMLYIRVRTENADGLQSDELSAPFREIYVEGRPSNSASTYQAGVPY